MKYYLEDLWEQAKDYGCIFKGLNHKYTIVNGCKIERYKDGTVQLYNCMVGGYWYKELTQMEVLNFAEKGFYKASLELAIKTLDKIIASQDEVRHKKRIAELSRLKKLYTKKLNNEG